MSANRQSIQKSRTKFPKSRLIDGPTHFYNRMVKIQTQTLSKLSIKRIQIPKKYRFSIDSFKNNKINQILIKSAQQPNNSHQNENIKFNRHIIDVLYRQHISNYNQYLVGLQDSENEDNALVKEKIQDLCYIGIARNYLKNRKYRNVPRYSRVNLLIRAYMLDLIQEEIQQKSQDNPNAIFIPCCQTALSFNHQQYPQKLVGIISQPLFKSTIIDVNHIIQAEYLKYKMSSYRGGLGWTKSQVTTIFLIIILLVALLMTKSWYLPILILAVLVVGISISSIQCIWRLNNLVENKNVSQKIEGRIKSYLKSVNNQQFQWKVGKDFYWLEIHLIMKKKKLIPLIPIKHN